MFQGWITSFIDPVVDDTTQQWAALMLPVMMATLTVYGARFLTLGRIDTRSATVDSDRHHLGDRRFSSARLWFSAFAAQTAAAAGIETHLEGDDVLDLELIAIQETMLRSSNDVLPDEDFETLEWLTDHFRRELMDEEFESLDRPALSSCWLAFGTVTQTGIGVASRSVAKLRFVNAGDLGREAFATMEWRGGSRRLGRRRQPLVGLVREPDPALLGLCLERLPETISPPQGDDASQSGLCHRLLVCGTDEHVEGPLTDHFVSVAQTARLAITGTWGDHWWTSAPGLALEARSATNVRCQLFTDTDSPPLRRAKAFDRNSTNARA